MTTSSLYDYAARNRLSIPYEQKLRGCATITCFIAIVSTFVLFFLFIMVISHTREALENARRLPGGGMVPSDRWVSYGGLIPSDQFLQFARDSLKPLAICGLVSLIISLISAYYHRKQRPIEELERMNPNHPPPG